MKSTILLVCLTVLILSGCSSTLDQQAVAVSTAENKVLFLKVDYITNTFEGGKELIFSQNSSTFSVSKLYVAPSDFGSLKLTYQEINQPLFNGTIIWMGLGQINYPQNLLPASAFAMVPTNDMVMPSAGFQNVFPESTQIVNYNSPWQSVQMVQKVRQYLTSNPDGSVKIFLYTPGVGIGDPAYFKWIFMLKN